MNEHATLPKVIILVLDNDVVKDIEQVDSTLPVSVETLLNWLIKEVNQVVQNYKNYLPKKSLCEYVPHILWICPPTHKYFGERSNLKRKEMTKCLNELLKSQTNMSCLQMVKIWDHEDSSLFIYDLYRFTTERIKKYWLSVDSAIRYWVTAIAPKIGKTFPKQKAFRNHFKWRRQEDRKYPTLPPR